MRSLRRFELFGQLSSGAEQRLLQRLSAQTPAAGTIIFQAGELISGLFLVETGCVKLYKLSPEGQEQILMILQGGQVVSEWTLFAGDRYPVSAQCVAATSLWFLERDAIVAELRQDPSLAMDFLGCISRKLRRLAWLLLDLTLRDARGRICRYLGSLLPESALVGPVTITLPTSQATVACMLGITSETMSRTMGQLRGDGLLVSDGRRRFIIPDPGRLRTAAGEADLPF